MDKFIQVCDVYFRYDSDDESSRNNFALNGVNMEIGRGEFVAVVGHNGSGKSTLAKHFNSIYLPVAGNIYVNGINTKDDDRLFDIRKSVGLVLQNPDNQIVAGIVEEDVAFGCENLGVPSKEIRSRVDNALKTVGMYEYRTHSPDKLSGGQKQRVAIAGIIAMEPECIVLDEPTAMLDPQGRNEVISTIHDLNKRMGITIILITHYMEEAEKLCDRIIIINKGKIVADGTVNEIKEKGGSDNLREVFGNLVGNKEDWV